MIEWEFRGEKSLTDRCHSVHRIRLQRMRAAWMEDARTDAVMRDASTIAANAIASALGLPFSLLAISIL